MATNYKYGKGLQDFLALDDVTDQDMQLDTPTDSPAVDETSNKTGTPEAAQPSSPLAQTAPLPEHNTGMSSLRTASTPHIPNTLLGDDITSPPAPIVVNAFTASPPHTIKPIRHGIHTPGTVKIPVPKGEITDSPLMANGGPAWEGAVMSPAYAAPANANAPARPLAVFSPGFSDLSEASTLRDTPTGSDPTI